MPAEGTFSISRERFPVSRELDKGLTGTNFYDDEIEITYCGHSQLLPTSLGYLILVKPIDLRIL